MKQKKSLKEIAKSEVLDQKQALLDDICRAEKQIREGNGVSHSAARRRLLKRFKK